MFVYLFPLGCIAVIMFGVWLVVHTIKRAWQESLDIDPNHDYHE